MSFDVVRFTEPVKAADVNRFQDNVATEFQALEAPTTLPVQVVQWTAANPNYTVRPTDVWLIVNSRGGPIKIVLPVPARVSQAVTILNAFASNKVTIAQADGGAMAQGTTSFAVKGGESATMVTDGKGWYRFGFATP